MPRARSRRRPAATPPPRDRKGEFEPRLIEKHQTRCTGFDEKVRSLYARGMTTREIQGQLEERVRHRGQSVADQRHEGRVENRAVFVALGITLEGQKEVLGLWTGAGEGSRFWWEVLIELRNRGVKDIYVACVDGLRGFPQAIETIFPKAQVQLCIVHRIRNSRHDVTCDQVPGHRQALARAVGAYDSVLRDAGGAAQSNLYNQYRGVLAWPVAQSHQDARRVSQRRGGAQAVVLAIVKTAGQWHTVQNWKPALNYLEAARGDRMREASSAQ